MFIRSRCACSLLLLGALSACQRAATPPATALTSASAQKASAPTPLSPPAPAPSAAASVAPTADPSPFNEAVRLGYAAQLMVTGKSALLGTDKLLLSIRDDQVSLDPALLEGLRPERGRFARVYGDLPSPS